MRIPKWLYRVLPRALSCYLFERELKRLETDERVYLPRSTTITWVDSTEELLIGVPASKQKYKA